MHCKAFVNNSSSNVQLSKTQQSKIIQSAGFLGRLLGLLLKADLPLIKNALKPWRKSILVPLELTAAVLAADAAIYKKFLGSGMATSIILNKWMDDIMKTVKSLEEYGLLIKGVSKTIKNEEKEEKCGFLRMWLGTLGASLIGKLLTGKGVKAKIPGQGLIKASEETIRAGQGF